MAQIVPPSRQQYEDNRFAAWHRTFKVEYEDLVSAGYMEGAFPLSYGSTVTDLDTVEGTVAFYEAQLAYPAELSASTVYLASSSASDTGQFTIQGIDANGDYAVATVTATGTTPAAVPGTWNHVQRCISNGAVNVGTVYVSTDSGALPTTTGDQIQTVMLPGTSYAINPLLVCPNNQIFLLHRFDFSISVRGASNAARIDIEANRQGRWIQNFVFFTDGQFEQQFNVPLRLFEGDKLRVKVTAGVNDTNGAFGFNGKVLTNVGVDERKGGIWEIFE